MRLRINLEAGKQREEEYTYTERERERVNGRREENGARDLYGRKIRRRGFWVSVNTPCCVVATMDHWFGLHITEPNRSFLYWNKTRPLGIWAL